MAIVFVFNVMVVRKIEIDSRYPGGSDQFRSERMKGWWFEDNHLLVCSSMGSFDKNFVDRLTSLGMDVFFTSEAEPPEENVRRCSWLEWDVYERREIKSPDGRLIQVHPVARHWLRGTDAGETVTLTLPSEHVPHNRPVLGFYPAVVVAVGKWEAGFAFHFSTACLLPPHLVSFPLAGLLLFQSSSNRAGLT